MATLADLWQTWTWNIAILGYHVEAPPEGQSMFTMAVLSTDKWLLQLFDTSSAAKYLCSSCAALYWWKRLNKNLSIVSPQQQMCVNDDAVGAFQYTCHLLLRLSTEPWGESALSPVVSHFNHSTMWIHFLWAHQNTVMFSWSQHLRFRADRINWTAVVSVSESETAPFWSMPSLNASFPPTNCLVCFSNSNFVCW